MNREVRNAYADELCAASYAKLDYPGTYYLAFRDLPALIERHVRGRTGLDFGCGAGRSSRFLKDLGFSVVGVDIAEAMLVHARARDPGGDYRLVPDGDLGALEGNSYDLVLSAFTFDNIPSRETRQALFASFARLLRKDGCVVNLVSSPDMYVNEWASFSTKDFPENRAAKSGEIVRIVGLAVEDRRPVEDVLWTDADYRDLYSNAGLDVVETQRPLGVASDPCSWVSETRVPPWAIYVLKRRRSE